MKALILDSGPLINLSMNGLLYILEKLKENFEGKFLITEEVKQEVYDHPLTVKKFELGALRIEKLIQDGIIELPSSLGIEKKILKDQTEKFMNIINHTLKAENHWINLVSKAETSCLSLSSELTKRKIESIIAVDERTIRILFEKPENLEQLMAHKLHKKVVLASSEIKKFKNFKFIRSPELVYVAHKKNLTNIEGKKALEALLYATKYKGSSISFEEIDVLKRL